MDAISIIGRLSEDNPNPPTDAELTSALDDLTAALDAATSAETPDLEVAKQISEGRKVIVAEQTKRAEAAEAARAEARALREGVFTDETPGDPEEGEESEDKESEDKAPEPVAASVPDLVKRLTTTMTARVPAKSAPAEVHGVSLKAVGPASGFDLSADADFRELGHLFSTHGRSQTGKGVQVPLVRLERSYPDERILGENSQLNAKRLADALGVGIATQAPIAAAGGICGPGDVDHRHPICSERGRVVTSALPQFNASRGTLTYPPSISIGDLEDGITVWTSETDANPGQEVKACPPLSCVEELTASVDAVVRCVTVGNFQAKFSPEWWAANLEVLGAAHDRAAEQKALTELYTLSDSFGSVNEGSTLWNFLQALRNVISADKSARRNWTGGYTAIADAYGKDQMKNQLAANLGAGGSIREALLEADAVIDAAIADAGVTNMVWTYDGTYTGSTHRVIANHSQSGHLPPADFGLLIFPEDAFIFLDGGTLDLGTEITDSTLNSTNDRQAFAETFEKVAKRGCSSFRGVITVDASCGCGLTSI